MKFLKYLLIIVALLLIGGYFYISSQSDDYDVSRSKLINAPISKVFNTVNDIKTWEKWGPWHDQDPTIKVTYGEKTIGLGASSSWTGKDSPGKMETIKIIPNKTIVQKMQFGDLEPSEIIWNFEEAEGGTKVTWQMKEDKAPFAFKMGAAFMGGWDKMLGTMQEDGLTNMNKVIMETPDNFKLSEVSSIDLSSQKFIGYHVKMKINHEEMTKAFLDNMPKAGMYADKSGLKHGDYLPGAVYTKYDEATQETEFYIGLILNKNLKPAEGMTALNLPSGKGVKISKFGNYGDGDFEAHTAIATYLSANKMEQFYPIWETYPNDPTMVKPADIQTDIYYPVK